MSPVLRYHTGGGVYADLPGNIEEVTISPNQPPVNTDLWVDTDDDSGGTANLLSGFRNVIRNGDMSIAQRGTGTWSNYNGYCVDGVLLDVGGGVTTSAVRANLADGSAPIAAAGSVYRLNIEVNSSSANAATATARCQVPIEDVRIFAGKTVTLSFWAASSGAAGTFKLGLEAAQSFGSGGSASVYLSIGAVTLPSDYSYQKYNVTFTVPSIAGKTVGTGSCLLLLFWLTAGSNFAVRASNIGLQTWTVNLVDLQLEEGGVATPFERIPIQQQLAWCQRYFQRIGTDNPHMANPTNSTLGNGVGANTTVAVCDLFYPPMRIAPTVNASSSTGFGIGSGSNWVRSTAVAINGTGSRSFNTSITVASGSVANAFFIVYPWAATGGYFDLSAEL